MEKKPKKNKYGVIIEGCDFTGVSWDNATIDVIKVVAQGLTNLTELFKSQNITIESLLTINDGKENK